MNKEDFEMGKKIDKEKTKTEEVNTITFTPAKQESDRFFNSILEILPKENVIEYDPFDLRGKAVLEFDSDASVEDQDGHGFGIMSDAEVKETLDTFGAPITNDNSGFVFVTDPDITNANNIQDTTPAEEEKLRLISWAKGLNMAPQFSNRRCIEIRNKAAAELIKIQGKIILAAESVK